MKLKTSVKDLQICFTSWKLIYKVGGTEELEMYAWYKSDEGETVIVAVIKRLRERGRKKDYVKFSPVQCGGRQRLGGPTEILSDINGVRRWVMEELSSEWRPLGEDADWTTDAGYLRMKKHRYNVSWPGLDFMDGQRMYYMEENVCTF
tara:strand:+ start:266 stop:709 length:444 start_codon:yes stop_codon:yes gene_type:complete